MFYQFQQYKKMNQNLKFFHELLICPLNPSILKYLDLMKDTYVLHLNLSMSIGSKKLNLKIVFDTKKHR